MKTFWVSLVPSKRSDGLNFQGATHEIFNKALLLAHLLKTKLTNKFLWIFVFVDFPGFKLVYQVSYELYL